MKNKHLFVEHTFSNGLKVLLLHTPQKPSFEVSMHIFAGSSNETKETNGVFHFIEHMLFRGCEKYKNSIALANAMETLGGENNGITGQEMTSYWIEGRDSKTIEGINLFSDFFLYPNWADFDTERSIICREIDSDYNEDGLLIDTPSLAMTALFSKHPLGFPVGGTPQSLKKITKQTLLKYRSLFYTPEHSLLTVCSSVNPTQVLSQIEKTLGQPWEYVQGSRPVRTTIPPIIQAKKQKPHTKIICQDDSDNQFQMRLVFPLSRTNYKNYVAGMCLERLLDDGLSSRLPESLREKHGLVYDISADLEICTDLFMLNIDLVMSKDTIHKSLEVLKATLLDVLNTPPTPTEMKRIFERYAFSLDVLESEPVDSLEHLAWSNFFTPNFNSTLEREYLASTTASDIQDAAIQIFSARDRAAVLVGPDASNFAEQLEDIASVVAIC